MNLLVKKIGLVLLPALFFACEDPTELGANLNPNTGALSVHYAEFPLETSQVRSDSVFTAIRQFDANTFFQPYIGRIQNDDFGTVQANLYSNLSLSALPNIGTFVRLDSAVVELYWNNRGVYGSELTTIQRFSVHQLTAPIAPTRTEAVNDSVSVNHYNYFIRQTREVAEKIGEFSLNIAPYAAGLDTAAAIQQLQQRRLSARIDQSLGEQLLSRLRANQQLTRVQQQQAFSDFFKGIAIIPDATNTFMTTFDVVSQNAGLTLYYTQGTEQRRIRLHFIEPKPNMVPYVFSSHPTYFALEVDQTGTSLANAPAAGHLQAFQPLDSRVYFQGISGIYPKVDLTPFKDYVVSLQDEGVFVLNRAVVEIDSVVAGVPGRQPLPQTIEFYFVDDNNRRFQAAFGQAGTYERATAIFNRSYMVGETRVNYYQADIAFNLEQFLRTGEDRYLQAIIYPVDALFSSPNRFVVQKQQVKLKLWYTKMKDSTN